MFFDPAYSYRNFLLISYRELRWLQLEVLRAPHSSGQLSVDAVCLRTPKKRLPLFSQYRLQQLPLAKFIIKSASSAY